MSSSDETVFGAMLEAAGGPSSAEPPSPAALSPPGAGADFPRLSNFSRSKASCIRASSALLRGGAPDGASSTAASSPDGAFVSFISARTLANQAARLRYTDPCLSATASSAFCASSAASLRSPVACNAWLRRRLALMYVGSASSAARASAAADCASTSASVSSAGSSMSASDAVARFVRSNARRCARSALASSPLPSSAARPSP
mmetsp:Transcript_35050/g.110277  ORF Transcript_35050/g.110277 Transcript_35050/m.110277 type:complete len:204 (+) Transcript_35050:383-994(+)